MLDRLSRKYISFLLVLLLLLSTIGCTAKPQQPEAPVPDAPVEVVELQSASTPAPTATPIPDPLFGDWSDASATRLLTLLSDGTFRAEKDGAGISGTFERTGTQLLLQTPLGSASISATVQADGLTAVMADGTSIALIRAERSAAGADMQVSDAPFSVSVEKAIVTVRMKKGLTAADYCFRVVEGEPPADSYDWVKVNASEFSVFKTDGDYYLWVRDASGSVMAPQRVKVESGFTYVIRGEGLTALHEPMAEFLESKGTSVDALNAEISRDVAEAGLYTRCGVLTAGVSTVSRLAELGVSAPYQGEGSYQAEGDWGVNPAWGSRLPYPTKDGNGTYYHTGMQCVAAIVWAYRFAGMNISNHIGGKLGRLGERERTNDNKIDYRAAKGGDIVQADAHYLMIVDRLDTDMDGVDDTYLTYEMMAPHLAFLKLTFHQMRYRPSFSMDAVFENQGRFREKSRIWEDTFFIPYEVLPSYLTDAVEAAEAEKRVDALFVELGLV